MLTGATHTTFLINGKTAEPLKTGKPNVFKVKVGEHYRVIQGKAEEDQLADNVIVRKTGDDLQLQFADGTQVTLEKYYDECKAASSCDLTLPGQDGGSYKIGVDSASGAALGDGSILVYAHGTHDMLMSMAQGNAALYSTLASLQGAEISYIPGAFSNSAGYGLLGALGGGIVLAAMAGGGAAPASSNASAVTPDTTPPTAPTTSLASDSGIANDSITNVGTVNVTALEAGASWQYSTNGGTSWTAGTGTSFTLTGDGAKSVIVRQTDVAGNVSVASSALAFTLDTTPPGIQSLAAHSVSKTIDITYDGGLDATHLPPATAFSVTTGGAANPVASVSLAGSVMTLTLANAFAAGAVNVSYIDPTAGNDVNAIQDLAGNDAGSFASGVVADGYVRGASVYIDTNHNGNADPGTDYFVGTTDANGNFFIPSGVPGGSIIAIGGVNIDTGVPNTMPLKAPEGSTTINPLTTLVEAVVQASGGITSAAAAAATVATNLGLTVPVGQTLLGYDPFAAGDLTAQKAAAQVATIITLAENAVAGAGSAVVSNLVTELNNASGSGSTLDLADSATLDSMLGNSLSGASAQVQSAIADASAAIGNAASLSAVATAQSQALDTIAAQAPSLSVAAITNDTTPSVRVSFNTSATDGTAAVVGDALAVQDGGVQIGTKATLSASDVAAGYKDLTTNVLTEGSHSLSATLTDQAGNTSAASVAALVNIDTQAPSAPSLNAVATDDLIGSNEQASVISGSAEANATVTLSVGANNHTMTASNGGAWSYTLTASDITAMGQGPETLSATATDAAGNVSAAGTRAISVDTVAPTIIAVVTGADDNVTPVTGNITAGSTTNDNTLGLSGTVSGTLGTGEAVFVYDGATRLGEATVASSTWTFSTASLGNATHSFSARVEDAAGNLGAGSSPYAVTVNATVPTATATITAVTDDVAQVTGTIASAGLTNDNTPVLSGAIVGTLGTDIVVIYDGASRLGAASVAGSSWSYVPTTLSSGNHNFTAVIESAGGNQGAASSDYAIAVDTTAPLAPSINTVAVDNVINSAEQTAVIGGSAEAGSTLELSIGGNTRSVSTNGSGTWSYTLTPTDIGAMGQGAETLSATTTDVAGNLSAPGTRLISIDTVAPTTTINAVAGDNAVNAPELASGVTVTGNSEAGAQIALTLGSGNIRSVTADGSTGAWTYTLNIADIKAMGQGNETLSATATDAAGNTGAANSRAISIDSVAPALTSFSLAAASDSGAVGDGKSNVATPSIEFAAENGSTLEVNQGQGAAYVAAGAGTGVAQALVMPTAFASDGSYTISLRATDAAGNTTVRSGNYVLDRAALNSTSITGITDDVGTIQGLVPNNGSTDDTVLIINGSAEAYASVTVFDNVTKLGTAVIANETGAWSFTTPTLSSGVTYAFNARTADASGNTGNASMSQTVSIDTLAPTLTISSDVASVKSGETATITFTFSEDPGSSFAGGDITTTGGTLGAISGTGLTRSATFTPTAGASGNASITVAGTAYTDAAGNTGGAGATPTIAIDTLAPTLAISSDVSTLKADETATITFTFSEDPGSSFVWDGGTGDVVVSGGALGAISGTGLTRTATFTPTPGLASGNASITVAAAAYTDAAGNTGAAGSTPSIGIDTLAPTLVIRSDTSAVAVRVGHTANITFTFSEDPGASFVDADVVTSVGTLGPLSGTGLTRTAVFTPPAGLASGNASITVNAAAYSDAAGNSGGAGTTSEIFIDTVAPTLAITSDVSTLKAGESATITFTFSEDPGASFVGSNMLGAGDVVVSGGTLSAISGSDLTRTATFTPSVDLSSGNASITVASATYTDAAGNAGSAGSTPTISIDTLAPTLAITSNVAAVKAGETASITFTFSEAPGSSFAAGDITTTGGTLGSISGTGLTRSATFTPTPGLASGNASITVASATYADAAGNTGGAGSTPAISIDTLAPTLAITSNVAALKAGETATITFTFGEDPGSSFVWDGSTGDVVVSGGTLGSISGSGLTRSATFTPTPGLASGNASITVASATYADAAGNTGGAGSTPSINIDTLAPTLAITSNVAAVKAGETAAITFTFSEDPGSSFVWDGSTGDVVVSGGTLGSISGTGLTRSATFTPTPGLASGNASITVASATYADAAGNTGGAGSTPAISIDTLAPTLAISSDVSTLKADETATITFTFSEDPGSSFVWDGSAGDVVVSGGTLGAISGSGLTRSATFTPTPGLASGNASITVASATYADAAGNTGGAATTPSISIDTLAPTLAITSNVAAVKSGETATITFTFSEDPLSSFVWDGSTGDVVVSGGTLGAISGSGLTRSATFTPTPGLASGNASITVAGATYTDAAGNTGGAGTTPSISIDTVAPTLAITSNVSAVNAGETATITFTFSEAPIGFADADITTTGGTLSAISGTGLTRSATFTPTAGVAADHASITVASATYTNSAGNAGGAGSSPILSIDTLAPTLAITSNVATLKSGESATITFTFSEDPGSSFVWNGSAGDVVVSGGTLGAISGTGLTRFATFTPTPGLSSGNASITVAAGSYTDTAGNVGAAGTTPTIAMDTLVPTLAITSNVAVVKAGETATITFTFSEAPIGFADADITTTGGTLSAISGSGLTRTATFTPTVDLVSGNASITVAGATYTDAAGNTGGAGTTPSIFIDTVAPTLAISSDVSTLKAGDTATITFTFSEDPGNTFAWDGSAGDLVVSGGTLGAISGRGLWRVASFTPTPDLASGNASITVASATYTDAAGNAGAAGTTPSISINTLVPTLTITINVAAVKAGDTATITFTFNEAPVGFTDADITTTGGTLSAISGSGLTRTATFTPTPGLASGNASITVASATYTDTAGNTGGPGRTPSISIDTLAPTLAITSDRSTLKAGETATIVFTFSEDPGSSFVWNGNAGDVVVSGGSLSAISGAGLTRTAIFTPTVDLASGDASITVAASNYTDTAGNVGAAGTTRTIAMDTLAPTLAITSNVATLKSGESANITFTFSEDPGSSFAAGDISTTGGTLSAISGSGLTRNATFTPTPGLSSGNASITVADSSYADTAGNTGGAGTTPSIRIDTVAPTLAITSDVSALKAGGTATIVFTFSEDPGDTFAWDGSAGDVVVSGGTLSAISGSGLWRVAGFTPTAGLASGSASITVASATYTDAAGNTGGAGSMPSISIDTLVPTLSITSDVAAVKTGETAAITFTFSEDPGNSFADGDISTMGGTLGAISGTGLTRSATFTPTPDLASGNASITVAGRSYTDTAGNGGAAGTTPTIAIDTLAPTLAITSNVAAVKSGETAAITFTFSEDPGSTFAWDGSTGDVAVSGGTLGAISGTGLTRSATFTPTANLASGNASITVAASSYTDAAGNTGGAGSTPSISIDTLAPTLVITSDRLVFKIGDTATITFTFSEDPGSSFVWNGSTGDVTPYGGTLSAISGSGLIRTATFTPELFQDDWTFYSAIFVGEGGGTYSDAAGNHSQGYTWSNQFIIDTVAPTAAVESAVFTSASHTLVLTGSNFSSLLGSSQDHWEGNVYVYGENASTDIKARLDWSKLSLDINGDNSATPDVSFSLSDISSARVTDSTHLTVVLTYAKALALISTSGFGANPVPDTLDIAAGFAVDQHGNVASNDARANLPLTAVVPVAGDTVIDLGASGKLINGVQVDGGNWYYLWDRNGDGSITSADQTTHNVLDGIFNQDIYGVANATVANADGLYGSTDLYHYATLGGVRLSLPTIGGGEATPYGPHGLDWGQFWTKVTGNESNPQYDDLLAVWDAFNDNPVGINGTPPGWSAASSLWSSTPTVAGHAVLYPTLGRPKSWPDSATNYVALQVVVGAPPTLVITDDKPGIGNISGGDILYTFTFDQDVTGFDATDITVAHGTPGAFTANSAHGYTLVVTPTPGYTGNVTVDVPASVAVETGGRANIAAAQSVQAVDMLAPAVTGLALSSPKAGVLKEGDVVVVTATVSEAMTVTGSPQIELNIGGSAVLASYVSGTGSTALVFNYIVQTGQTDSNGISIGANKLSGSLTDAAGNALTLTHNAVADDASHTVDTTAPTAPTAVTLTAVGGTVRPNTINTGNTSLTAAATIVAGEATGGSALLQIGGVTVATDSSIAAGDTSVSFTTSDGTPTNAELQVAIASWGVATVVLIDAAGHATTSSANNPFLRRDMTTVPTVWYIGAGGLTGEQNGWLNTGDVVSLAVTMSEAITVTGTPQLELDIGGTAVLANYVSGSGSWVLVFSYTIQAGLSASGFSLAANKLTLNGGTLTNDVGNAATLSHSAMYGLYWSYRIDALAPSAPTIDAVATDNVINGAEAGTATSITGTNEPGCTVVLTFGANSRVATVSGSTWSYTLVTDDLAAMGQGAETLSVTQTDAAGNTSSTGTRSITVDTLALTAPTAVTVTAAGGTVLPNTITLSNTSLTAAASIVAGEATGGSARLSINGATVATDSSIAAGDTSVSFTTSDGTPTNAELQAAIASGGEVTVVLMDAVGNAATSSVNNPTLVRDMTVPTVSGIAISGSTGAKYSSVNSLNTGDVLSLVVTMSEATTVTGTPQLELDIGGSPVLANYVSGSGSRSLVFNYTIQAGQNDSNGISVAANKLTLNGGTLQDAVGNAAMLTHSALADNPNYVVDNTAPLISSIALTGGTGGVLNVGDVVHITVTMNEPVDVGKVVPTYDPNTGHYLGDLVTEPQLALKIGDSVVLASYDNTHWWLQTPTTLLFTLGIWSGQNDTNGISIPANALTLHGGYINDLAGNAATLAYSAVDDNANYLVDSTAPTVRSVAISSASGISNGFLNAGDVVSITVTMSDATTVTGTTPYLWLTGLGSANYASGSGTTSLVFNYTIQAGQNVPGGISVHGSLYSEQGYLTGSRGNLVYSNVLPFPALPANAGYRVDTTAPFVLGGGGYLSGATGAVNGVLSAGDVVSFTVVMSEATVVTGTPHYELNIGSSAVQASYASGSGGTDLIFNYTILPGQSDTDGINWSSNKLTLNGGTLTDLAGNVATLRASDYTVPAQADYKVDAIGPVFSSSSAASFSEATRGPAYDATAENDAGVTYTLSGPDAALFYLNDDYYHHGLVTFNSQPDYEQPHDSNADNVYNLTVTATDNAGNATNQAVAITVTNGADPIDLGWVTLFMPDVTIVNPYGPGTSFIHVANTTPLMGTQDLWSYLIHLGASGNAAAIPMAALFSLFGLTDTSIEMPPVITEVVHLDLTAPVTMSNGKTYCLVNATVQYWQYDHIDNWVWDPAWFFDTGSNTWVHGKDVKVGPGIDRWDLVYTSTSNALSHEQLDFLMGGAVQWDERWGMSTVEDMVNTQPSGAAAGVDDARTVLLSGHTLVLPTTSELQALVQDNPNFEPPAGWGDVNQYFWSATQSGANSHESVMLYGPGYVTSFGDPSLHPVVFQVL